MQSRLLRAFAVGAVLASVAALRADVPASRQDADLFRQKIAAIAAVGVTAPGRPLRTTVSEREVNAYLALDLRETLPAGVIEPAISILGDGRLSGRAVVDLDSVRRQNRPTGLFDPMMILRGHLPITAVGTLTAANGVGRFDLESATVGGLPVPKTVLQQIVSYYSQSPDRPSGVGLDDPFALPARIREIQVGRGQAVIVQ